MSGADRPEQLIDRGSNGLRTACTALALVAAPTRWTSLPQRSLPDPTFVTQLIATSEHIPQAPRRRRTDMTEALLAYRLASGIARAGLCTRQSI
jgi:hypothetical protein